MEQSKAKAEPEPEPEQQLAQDNQQQHQFEKDQEHEEIPQGHEPLPLPKTQAKGSKVIVDPRLKPIPYKQLDFSRQNKIAKHYHHTNKSIRFYNNEDCPVNKRGFKYKPCKPNPLFRSTLYSTTDLPPYGVRPSYFDKSSGIVFSDNMSYVSNSEQGWRSIRSNIGVSEGSWYFEFNIVNGHEAPANARDGAVDSDNRSSPATEDEEEEVYVNGDGHVRVGVGRREASLEAPVGFDAYGYGIRDIGGQKVHLSRPQNFMDEDFQTGDTIGILIRLPSLEEHQQHYRSQLEACQNRFNSDGNLHRDQIPIKYKSSLYYEQFEYTAIEKMSKLLNPFKIIGEKLLDPKESDQLALMDIPKIPNSEIIVYKNGKEIGPIFQDLYSFLPINDNLQQQANLNYRNTNDGTLGYYPMVSIFKNAIVELNPGPRFKVDSLPSDVRPLCDRYNHQVIEQWYFDIVDEVENQFLDELETL